MFFTLFGNFIAAYKFTRSQLNHSFLTTFWTQTFQRFPRNSLRGSPDRSRQKWRFETQDFLAKSFLEIHAFLYIIFPPAKISGGPEMKVFKKSKMYMKISPKWKVPQNLNQYNWSMKVFFMFFFEKVSWRRQTIFGSQEPPGTFQEPVILILSLSKTAKISFFHYFLTKIIVLRVAIFLKKVFSDDIFWWKCNSDNGMSVECKMMQGLWKVWDLRM